MIPPAAPAALAARPLFEPLRGLLEAFSDPVLPNAAALTALVHAHAPGAVSGSGRPIRFVLPPPGDTAGYETHIHATGEVPTRPDDWHDFFNALAWAVWPRTKSTCNALHLQEIARRQAAGQAGRGPVRDALTQLDECGVIVVTYDPALPARLADHQWEAVFVTRRAQLATTTRFLVLGHATWDQLRAPFVGLCGKALVRRVEPAWFALDPFAQQAECDAWLAESLVARAASLTPRTWSPLPLLGIPGVTPESEDPAYYRDTRQFRAKRPDSKLDLLD